MAWVGRLVVGKMPIPSPVGRLCKTSAGGRCSVAKIQVAFISSRAMRGEEMQRPKPFPYKEKKFGRLRELFDDTKSRFDENSKIIVVEGPIAAGKTKVAEALAKELDMLYMPAASMDMTYINSYGYDLRQLDPRLPESGQSYDEKKFCETPKHENTADFQITMYLNRHSQYIDALAHLFSTGEGVVLERSPFSDMIFLESMYRAGYISKAARNVYNNIRKATQPDILKPHLVVYLDVPVENVKKNIIKRGLPHEVNSKVFTTEYLTDIDHLYKQEYLKQMSKFAHMLIYDWSEPGDVEIIVEDIERLDFDNLDPYGLKMSEWKLGRDEWPFLRRLYADEKTDLMTNAYIVNCEAPELLMDGQDAYDYFQVINNAPGEKYLKGFNADMGDTNLTWKSVPRDREHRTRFWF